MGLGGTHFCFIYAYAHLCPSCFGPDFIPILHQSEASDNWVRSWSGRQPGSTFPINGGKRTRNSATSAMHLTYAYTIRLPSLTPPPLLPHSSRNFHFPHLSNQTKQSCLFLSSPPPYKTHNTLHSHISKHTSTSSLSLFSLFLLLPTLPLLFFLLQQPCFKK